MAPLCKGSWMREAQTEGLRWVTPGSAWTCSGTLSLRTLLKGFIP